RISVAGQVNKHYLWMRLAGAAHLEEVDGSRTSGRVARLRDLAVHQRVDQARLADVRTPEEGDLRRARSRELVRGSRGRHEPGRDFHGFTMAAVLAKRKRVGFTRPHQERKGPHAAGLRMKHRGGLLMRR